MINNSNFFGVSVSYLPQKIMPLLSIIPWFVKNYKEKCFCELASIHKKANIWILKSNLMISNIFLKEKVRKKRNRTNQSFQEAFFLVFQSNSSFKILFMSEKMLLTGWWWGFFDDWHCHNAGNHLGATNQIFKAKKESEN